MSANGYDGLLSILNQSENDAVQGLGRFITNGVWLSASDVRLEEYLFVVNGCEQQFFQLVWQSSSINAFQASCVDGLQWSVARGVLFRVVCRFYL